MTKRVRIENADTSDHRLAVEVWAADGDGKPVQIMRTIEMGGPTEQVEEYVHAGQVLVVKEIE